MTPAERIAEWREEARYWQEQVNIILETVGATIQRVRNEALEEAAGLADEEAKSSEGTWTACAEHIAAAIRALKSD